MVKNKVILVLCLTASLGVSSCSRQQSDWQKTRETNTTDAYELFLKKYPSGEFTAQAQARVKELYEERDWQKARDADTLEAYQAFARQYPEGKWTEEARIRVENFTLASQPSSIAPTQSPEGAATPGAAATPGNGQSSAPGQSAAPGQSTAPTSVPNAGTAPKPHAAAKSKDRYRIQLGAFKSGAGAADNYWAQLQKTYPKLLGGLTPKVAPGKSASGTLFRLQVVNLSEKRANSLCKALKSHSQACVVLRP